MPASTAARTFSSKLQETRAAAGFTPKALATEAEWVALWSLLVWRVSEAEALHPTDAMDAAIVALAVSLPM